ncbi:hypothetical protein PFISCL1PPCAC_24152, partial [Pristionchus fissidentatus]
MEIDVSSDRLTAVVEDTVKSPNSLSPDPHGFSMIRKKSMKERMQEIEEKRNKKRKGKKKEKEVMSIFDAAMLIKHIPPQRIDLISANIQNEFGVCGWILTILSYILIFFTLPISACMCIKVVQEYERAVIFRLGRLMPGGAKGPGIFFIVPCIDTYRKVDLRVLSFEVPPQEILSKDSVTVAVDAVVYFRISNATISVTNVEDAARSTKLLAQTTLRNILGTKTLAEMLSDREAISHQMQSTLDEATEPWGVKVERVEVKDVRLPVQLQRAMAAEAEAAREARAKVIVAEGEQKASRALKEAAEVIAQSPSAIQLRYLQTLNSISAEKNSTIIFPFPIDLLSAFLTRAAPKQQSSVQRTAVQQQEPCELRQRLGSDSSSHQSAPAAHSSHTTTTSSYTTSSTWRPRPSPLTGLDTKTTVVRRGHGEVSIDIERNPSGEEEPPPLPKKIRSCCLYKYPDWVQGMVGEGRPPTSGGHGHSHGTMGPPPQESVLDSINGLQYLNVSCLIRVIFIVAPLLASSLRNPSMCWRLRNAKYLTEEIPLCKDEMECMRDAAYQSSAYSIPGPSTPAQLDPGSLYDWRRGGVTSSSGAAAPAATPTGAAAAGGGAKRPSVGGANGNTLLKQAIANRMIKEPKEEKEENREGMEKDSKEIQSKENDQMSSSLVMSAAWYRDDQGKTGFKNRDWEKAVKVQKSAVKEKKKKMEESGSTVEEIDEELLIEKKEDTASIVSGESSKSKKEVKEEKKEKERKEKEEKKRDKEEKKKEKEEKKKEEKEKKEEEKKEKERRKRSESPKAPKIEKAEREKEKRESKERDEEEDEKKKEKKKRDEKKEERNAQKPPKDPTKLKKTRSEDSSMTGKTMKISDSPRNQTLGDRRESSLSESSRISAISHKSVKFNDRIQVNEIERDEEESSSDDDFALMSDDEMRRLREAAEERQRGAPPTHGAPPNDYGRFDEDYGYEHWGDAGSGDYVDLDQLPVSVRRAIELEYSSRLAALRSSNRGEESAAAAGSMTRLHGDGAESLQSGAFPLLPRSASGYFDDPLRDSYVRAIDSEAMRRMEMEKEMRRREELQLLQMMERQQMQQVQQQQAPPPPPTHLPTGDMSGSFYDNVQGRMGEGAESATAAKSPNSEMFSYAPRRRQPSEVLQARAPASPTPSTRSSASAASADRAAFFAAMTRTTAPTGSAAPAAHTSSAAAAAEGDRSSSSVERVFGSIETTATPTRIDIMEATPPPDGWNQAEERMRKKFVERFGVRKAPVAESEFARRGSDAESMLSTDSRESVVSATSLRAE